MAQSAWSGLITNASPHAAPQGSAVEQVNLTCSVPGQIQSRGGMRSVSCIGEPGDVLDLYSYSFGGKRLALVMQTTGELVALESPAYGPETPAAVEPDLSVTTGQISISYTHRYVSGAFGPVDDITDRPEPPSPQYTEAISGGDADYYGLVPAYFVDALGGCQAIVNASPLDGGAAATEFRADLPVSSLCQEGGEGQ